MDYINYIVTKPKSAHIVTGFVIEFEDMLPYKTNLEVIRSEKAYTED